MDYDGVPGLRPKVKIIQTKNIIKARSKTIKSGSRTSFKEGTEENQCTEDFIFKALSGFSVVMYSDIEHLEKPESADPNNRDQQQKKDDLDELYNLNYVEQVGNIFQNRPARYVMGQDRPNLDADKIVEYPILNIIAPDKHQDESQVDVKSVKMHPALAEIYDAGCTIKKCMRLTYIIGAWFASLCFLIIMVVFGALYMNKCPTQPMLPYFPFIMGIIGVAMALLRTSMLLYGVSADLHDEYFSIILMLISSHYMANYGSDPIWFTNLMVCVRIFLLAWLVAGNIWFWSIWQPDYVAPPGDYIDNNQDEQYCSFTLYVFCFIMLVIIYFLLAGALGYMIWSFFQSDESVPPIKDIQASAKKKERTRHFQSSVLASP